MVQKRQLYEEEYDVSPKHLKLEHNCDLVPYLQFQPDKDEGCFFKPNIEDENGLSGNFTDHPVCATKDVDYTLPGCLSTSSTISKEDALSEAVPPLASDAYFHLLERSPVKQVSVGAEYQADIPECHGCDGDEIKFLGSSVIPMPENQTTHDNVNVASGRTECYCQNPGSAECVRQHIKESREILKARIGPKAFAGLGFGDMGEVVSEKWTEDDEQLFHEVLYSNPLSSSRNFWNHLAAEFPWRSSQEIVSYYFNVFMLRRRTEQNRVDPTNADSDDDESQGYDSCEHGNGFENHHNDSQPRKLHNSCSFDSISEKVIVDDNGDGGHDFLYDSGTSSDDDNGDGGHDFLYDSCTSSDSPGAPCTRKVNNHEFAFEPMDPRVWDVGYFSCAGTKTEFLPTGSMMEEVFGVESLNFETMDDNKSSN